MLFPTLKLKLFELRFGERKFYFEGLQRKLGVVIFGAVEIHAVFGAAAAATDQQAAVLRLPQIALLLRGLWRMIAVSVAVVSVRLPLDRDGKNMASAGKPHRRFRYFLLV